MACTINSRRRRLCLNRSSGLSRNRFVPKVSLADENASVVDGFGQTQLEDLGLKTALQKVLNFQTEHVIELHAALLEHSSADQTAKKGIT